MAKTAPKQLDEADDVAQDGEWADSDDAHRKGPAADRLVDIGNSFREKAAHKMSDAVNFSRDSFTRQRQQGCHQLQAKPPCNQLL